MWLQEDSHTNVCFAMPLGVCDITYMSICFSRNIKGPMCVRGSTGVSLRGCVCVCTDQAWWPAFVWLPSTPHLFTGKGRRLILSRRLHLLVTTTTYPRSLNYLIFWILFALIQSYLLLKSLSPVKDLEQPLSVSLSSSTQMGWAVEETGGRAEEDGREELEEEDAELNSS